MKNHPQKVPFLDIAKYAPNYSSDPIKLAAQVNQMHKDDALTTAVDPYQLQAISEWWNTMSKEQRTAAIQQRKHKVILSWDTKVLAKTNIKRISK